MFQAEPIQTLKFIRLSRSTGKAVESFILSNCGETSVEKGSLNLEALKFCIASQAYIIVMLLHGDIYC